jgi:hypothetical protein
MGLERTAFDKMVNGAFLGKRVMGRPLRYNIPHRNGAGWIELLFNPRNQVEKVTSSWIRFALPFLAVGTYNFHVERCREGGFRIEDVYELKFWKEPYYMWHVYAQNFHPSTLLDRVKDCAFYRRPRVFFKGFTVPDWATNEQQTGWEFDAYSRSAWDKALHDFHSEATPMQFVGYRLEPNALEWLRLEQWGRGLSSRLFYNEVPNPTWFRHGGHLDNKEEQLYSFTHASGPQHPEYNIDTTTPEGAEKWREEYKFLSQLTPELVPQKDFMLLHEYPKYVCEEPHFRRVWNLYRQKTLRVAIQQGVDAGAISAEDEAACIKFLGTSKNTLSVNQYLAAREGLRPDIAGTDGFNATTRVFESIGADFAANKNTAREYDSQFWHNFDQKYELTEIGMREDLPGLVSDPQNRLRVEAILDETQQVLDQVEEAAERNAPDAETA